MTRQVTGYFPDRETADHALAMLESAGLQVARTNVEDFGDPAYYEGQLPQGATAITVDNPADREAEVRSTMMQAGALQLQGHGVEGRPTGMTELIDAEAPTPVRDGERVPDDSDELSIRSPSNEVSTGLPADSTGGHWEAGDSETTEEPSYSENLRGHARH